MSVMPALTSIGGPFRVALANIRKVRCARWSKPPNDSEVKLAYDHELGAFGAARALQAGVTY